MKLLIVPILAGSLLVTVLGNQRSALQNRHNAPTSNNTSVMFHHRAYHNCKPEHFLAPDGFAQLTIEKPSLLEIIFILMEARSSHGMAVVVATSRSMPTWATILLATSRHFQVGRPSQSRDTMINNCFAQSTTPTRLISSHHGRIRQCYSIPSRRVRQSSMLKRYGRMLRTNYSTLMMAGTAIQSRYRASQTRSTNCGSSSLPETQVAGLWSSLLRPQTSRCSPARKPGSTLPATVLGSHWVARKARPPNFPGTPVGRTSLV